MKSGPYAITGSPDRDPEAGAGGGAPLLPFPAADLDRSALRMRPADFARLLEVSKQTVSQWVKAGKITLRPDGLLDPRAAVRQLVRTSDPARLRSRVLAPILAEVRAAQAREAGLLDTVAGLRRDLADADEESAFQEQAADELLDALHLFRARVLANLDALAALPHTDRDGALELLWPFADEPLPADSDGRECLNPRSPSEGEAGADSEAQPDEDLP